MRIREPNCFQVSGPAHVEAFEERQLQMLDVYPELARREPGGATEFSWITVLKNRLRRDGQSREQA
jgi:hypothetical protein